MLFSQLGFFVSSSDYVLTYPAGRFRPLAIGSNARRFISMIEHVARKLDSS